MGAVMSSFPSSPIKSVQRGLISLGAGSSYPQTATATITSVDTSKSLLAHLGVNVTNDGSAKGLVQLTFTNATTITATRGDPSNTAVVSFQVVEYN